MKKYLLLVTVILNFNLYAIDFSQYKFVSIDELKSYPSDYIGQNLFIKCRMSQYAQIMERPDGRYSLQTECLQKDTKFSTNTYDIAIITNRENINKIEATQNKRLKFKAYGTLSWSDSYSFGQKSLFLTKNIEIEKDFFE